MGSYDDWNKALISDFTGGLPRGSAVFLSVDDDALRAAGKGLLTVQLGADAVVDFCVAVRRRVVRGKHHVNVAALRGDQTVGPPEGLAFLCAMVLAATRMATRSTSLSSTISAVYTRCSAYRFRITVLQGCKGDLKSRFGSLGTAFYAVKGS